MRNESQNAALSFSIIIKMAGLGFLAGSIIGQLIDPAFTMSGSLHYHWPTFEIKSLNIEFCWWIMVLYGIAGMILAVAHPILDRITRQEPAGGFNPSWTFVLICFIFFLVHWFMGPFLSQAGISKILLLVILVVMALLVWWFFDRTKGGLLMLCLMAFSGTAIEIILINVFNLYHYTDPDVFGIPLWILGPYMCGSPINGNLGRKFLYMVQGSK